ncbi:hypothetical protein NIES4075_10590 [Tolypothrix sp. NIES-4075]|uniref:prepilin-type N-terminal cleavage/methylation domain-containing protein n=1 Tax=Tolypothrix sp. NIES-4075 TaxID=2005459 RepID=UPI000B5C257F|nr:prepilin-type N-terminal cleavage/methylation domain-containing protein [Tolypothrix sp. NIES-4075]GAX40097.1 hypothetical protein NIES4075_10590 [Tolypothrix sp. NIES-4075]
MNKQSLSTQSEAGFTLIELLVIIIMVGVLVAIAVPGWLGFLNQQRLNAAQSKTLMLLRNAQANARREKLSWQACFWDDGNQVLATVQRVNSSTNQCSSANGESLIEGNSKVVQFTSSFTQSPTNYYRVQFNYDGSIVNGQLGKIIFTPRTISSYKTCVIVETLLGSMRSAKNGRCD